MTFEEYVSKAAKLAAEAVSLADGMTDDAPEDAPEDFWAFRDVLYEFDQEVSAVVQSLGAVR